MGKLVFSLDNQFKEWISLHICAVLSALVRLCNDLFQYTTGRNSSIDSRVAAATRWPSGRVSVSRVRDRDSIPTSAVLCP